MKNEDVWALLKYRLEGKRSAQSIVNRTYYAMFYAALALLQKSGKVPSKHTGVISLFDTEFVAKGIFPKEMSKDFHKAFELRQVSDYKTSGSVSEEKTQEVLKNAVRFVEAVRSYLEAWRTQFNFQKAKWIKPTPK